MIDQIKKRFSKSKHQDNNWALITGATSGIGRETARKLAENNYNLIITGRRANLLDELSHNLEVENSITCIPLNFDVSKRSDCEMVFERNNEMLKKVNVLINNAGVGRGIELLDEGGLDDWDEMIDTNLKGLLYITRLCLPYLKENQPSHIVNIGSVAGRWVYPGGGVYCATKFGVQAISEALRMDLFGHDIRVSNIAQGIVETDFVEARLKSRERSDAYFQGMNTIKGKDVAECVHWCLSRPGHVNIQEMVVYATEQASISQVKIHKK